MEPDNLTIEDIGKIIEAQERVYGEKEDTLDDITLNDIENEPDITPKQQPVERTRKRGPPKALLEKRKAYNEALEKRSGKKQVVQKEEKPVIQEVVEQTDAPQEMRRVIVAGKVKYLPVKTSQPKTTIHTSTRPVAVSPVQSISTARRMAGSNISNTKKIPQKYAKQMENEYKKQTIKNVKNFSDLRRVRAMQDIVNNSGIDVNKASINELRRLRNEQRRQEQDQSRIRASNSKETAIQEILNNDKMSELAKTLAIKNLSVTNRTLRRKQDVNK